MPLDPAGFASCRDGMTHARCPGMSSERPQAHDDDQPATKGEMRATKDEVRALGVLIERVDANVRFLAESMTGTRTELMSAIAASEERLSLRIGRLEDAVRVHSAEIRELRSDVDRLDTSVRTNSVDIRELRSDVSELRRDFDRRDPDRLAALEARVAELEKRAGIG
jgi:chromosome segregation ATPase